MIEPLATSSGAYPKIWIEEGIKLKIKKNGFIKFMCLDLVYKCDRFMESFEYLLN